LAADGAAHIVVRPENLGLYFCLHHDPCHGSPNSLRPTDAIRMESAASFVSGQHSGHQPGGGSLMIQILFFLFAALAVGAAINVLLQKHVLYSSLSLIVMLTSVSGLFILLQAEFLAVINVIVYYGDTVVMLIFCI